MADIPRRSNAASGSEGLKEFLASGEPGKCYTRIGGDPDGMTIRSSDQETVEVYLKS